MSGLFVGELREADSVQVSTPVGPWCRVTYHQFRDHIGTPGCSLPVHTDTVHVFSDLHHGDKGLCLSALRQPVCAVNVAARVSTSPPVGHLNPNRRCRLTPSPNSSHSQHTLYPARFPRFQKTAERLVSKYTRWLLAYRLAVAGSTGMLTCAKAVRQLATGITEGKGPTYFPNRAPLRLNSALGRWANIVMSMSVYLLVCLSV